MFRLTQEALDYTDAQIKAEEKGIKPFEKNYPDLAGLAFEALPGGFGVRVMRKPETVLDLERMSREKIE